MLVAKLLGAKGQLQTWGKWCDFCLYPRLLCTHWGYLKAKTPNVDGSFLRLSDYTRLLSLWFYFRYIL